MTVDKFEWDYIVIQVPAQLFNLPKMWDPRLAWHYAQLMRDSSVLPYDWSLGRENVDGVAEMLSPKSNPLANTPREMHIWCPNWHAFNRALTLKERLEKTWLKTKFKILGMPKTADVEYDKWVGETSLESVKRLEPTWSCFNSEVYFSNNIATERERNLYSMFKEKYFEWSPTIYTRSSIGWRQRGSICFRFPAGAIEPSEVARILQKTKQTWWFDSLDWEDDLTEDQAWTMNVFKEVEKKEMSFQFVAHGNYLNVTPALIKIMRESGLAAMHFGEFPISHMGDPADSERIRGAFIACRNNDVKPLIDMVVDADITLQTARSACSFCTEFRVNDRPEIQVIPEKITSKELRAISGGKWHNPTKLSDLQVLGIQRAFEMARADLIK